MSLNLKDLSIGKLLFSYKKILKKAPEITPQKALNHIEKESQKNVKKITQKVEKKSGNKYWHDSKWKEGIRVIANTKYFYRSSWEANYARYLQVLKTKGIIRHWQHEPDKFYFNKVKRGLKAYIPDFKVFYFDGRIEYIEVKGYMDSKAKTKLKRFAKYYPKLVLKVINKEWFDEFKRLNHQIDGWEG